ncbi:bifunctional glutamate--cysteine ligase GshA/glutathione synthetase GshB, partial [Clostridium perfringens]
VYAHPRKESFTHAILETTVRSLRQRDTRSSSAICTFGLGITIFNQDYSREDMKKAFEIAFTHDQTVLLEEFMTGKEYRFLVMGDQVVGVLHRVPANVVGDGIHTIVQLVHEKNKDPLRGKGYKTPLE